MWSPTEYALRFAQTFALILMLLTVITAMNRYPDVFRDIKGVQFQVRFDRESLTNGTATDPDTTASLGKSEEKCR